MINCKLVDIIQQELNINIEHIDESVFDEKFNMLDVDLLYIIYILVRNNFVCKSELANLNCSDISFLNIINLCKKNCTDCQDIKQSIK